MAAATHVVVYRFVADVGGLDGAARVIQWSFAGGLVADAAFGFSTGVVCVVCGGDSGVDGAGGTGSGGGGTATATGAMVAGGNDAASPRGLTSSLRDGLATLLEGGSGAVDTARGGAASRAGSIDPGDGFNTRSSRGCAAG